MFNFFDALWSFINTIFSFITNFISGLITMVGILANCLTLPVTISGYFTPILSGCIIAVASISIIKLLLGWGNV